MAHNLNILVPNLGSTSLKYHILEMPSERVLARGKLERVQDYRQAIAQAEQAVRLYTINCAYLHHEEKTKGSLEPGKLGDLIVIDRDVLTCPVDDVRATRVLYTILGGKVVYERKE